MVQHSVTLPRASCELRSGRRTLIRRAVATLLSASVPIGISGSARGEVTLAAAASVATIVGAVAGVASFFSSQAFQSEVKRRLDTIQASLEALDAKIDVVISQLRAIPEMFRRELDAHQVRVFLAEATGYERAASSLLALAPSASQLAPPVLAQVRAHCEDYFVKIATMTAWGVGTYLGVARCFVSYLGMAQAVGVDRATLLSRVNQTTIWFKDSALFCEKKRIEEEKAASTKRATLNSERLRIFLGSTGIWERPDFIPPVGWSSTPPPQMVYHYYAFYAEINGSVSRAYTGAITKDRATKRNNDPRNWRVSPLMKVTQFFDERGDAAKEAQRRLDLVLRSLNEQREQIIKLDESAAYWREVGGGCATFRDRFEQLPRQ